MLKAVKNAAEIAGTRAAHLRDGAAVTRFLHWLAHEGQGGGVSEIKAAEALEAFRAETDPKVERSGVIALQVHGGAKCKVLYTDLTLSEVK